MFFSAAEVAMTHKTAPFALQKPPSVARISQTCSPRPTCEISRWWQLHLEVSGDFFVFAQLHATNPVCVSRVLNPRGTSDVTIICSSQGLRQFGTRTTSNAKVFQAVLAFRNIWRTNDAKQHRS